VRHHGDEVGAGTNELLFGAAFFELGASAAGELPGTHHLRAVERQEEPAPENAQPENIFSGAFARVGLFCPGSTAAIEALADACVSVLVSDVPGNGKCPAASAKATGKAASAELSCEAKEVTKPGTAPACRAKASSQLAVALTKAGFCGQSPTIHSDVDECAEAIASALPPTSTTSTSTTTTTTVP
jgi:hypothetical protein